VEALMARWRTAARPDADRAAAIEEADTIVRLVEFMFRASDHPSIADGDYSDEEGMRRLIAENPDWPQAEKALKHLDAARRVADAVKA
jgi:hypothetical protein